MVKNTIIPALIRTNIQMPISISRATMIRFYLKHVVRKSHRILTCSPLSPRTPDRKKRFSSIGNFK